MQVDDAFDNLRHKLDVLGYNQTFPLSAFGLVGALFQDLVKTTESLRDAKQRIGTLLEEKVCWDLGVEPYKCDNSRLLAECNSLHLELIRQREEFESREAELKIKLRKIETDKTYLEEHCCGLESRVRELVSKFSDPKSIKSKKDGVNMSKKPFISTVKAGTLIPGPNPEFGDKTRCPKCNHIAWAKHDQIAGYDIRQAQDDRKTLTEQIAFYKRKVEARDREIRRLNEQLSGGRPPAALAKNCCYKNIEILNEDVDILQKEKIEMAKQLYSSQETMHEAMQRAVKLEEENKLLKKRLKDLEHTALRLEKQANADIVEKDQDISQLKHELRHLRLKLQSGDDKYCKTCGFKYFVSSVGGSKNKSLGSCQKCLIQKELDQCISEKRNLEDKIDRMSSRENELIAEKDEIHGKNIELKEKVRQLEKGTDNKVIRGENVGQSDDSLTRLKYERDFFQKEYLQLLKKATNEKEIENLRAQLSMKERDLRALRNELLESKGHDSARSDKSMSSASVQAAILRAERERDTVKSALNLAQMERDSLAEELKRINEIKHSDKERYENEIREKERCISKLKDEIHEMQLSTGSRSTLKNDNEELNKKITQLESENSRLMTVYNKLKILQEQTEKALIDQQNRLVITESQLENATSRLNTLDTSRESARSEVSLLRNEISDLKTKVHILESEKENLILDLDVKTEKVVRLETELKVAYKNKEDFANKLQKLQTKFEQVKNDSKDRETDYESSTLESRMLRKEIATIKLARDQTVEENNRIINELADKTAELSLASHNLKEARREVDSLKLQLQQYVQEVQRVEELLLLKEQEREEMLEHYHALTHDTVLLEGNHHTLEVEAAEQKRQLAETENELLRLKNELSIKDECLERLQKQVTCLSEQIVDLENELEKANDDKRLLNADLGASKEICDKLDLQRDKLNAEVDECNNIRKQLESDNEKLRKDLINIQSGDKTVIESLRELLSSSRHDLDNQRKIASNLNQEVIKLKGKISQLEDELAHKQEESKRNEALVREYGVQVQELRHNIANDRFEMARNREESARSDQFYGKSNESQNCDSSFPFKTSHDAEITDSRKLKQKKKSEKVQKHSKLSITSSVTKKSLDARQNVPSVKNTKRNDHSNQQTRIPILNGQSSVQNTQRSTQTCVSLSDMESESQKKYHTKESDRSHSSSSVKETSLNPIQSWNFQSECKQSLEKDADCKKGEANEQILSSNCFSEYQEFFTVPIDGEYVASLQKSYMCLMTKVVSPSYKLEEIEHSQGTALCTDSDFLKDQISKKSENHLVTNDDSVSISSSTSSFTGCDCMKEKYKKLKKLISKT